VVERAALHRVPQHLLLKQVPRHVAESLELRDYLGMEEEGRWGQSLEVDFLPECGERGSGGQRHGSFSASES
jgi:hypothetical protein